MFATAGDLTPVLFAAVYYTDPYWCGYTNQLEFQLFDELIIQLINKLINKLHGRVVLIFHLVNYVVEMTE